MRQDGNLPPAGSVASPFIFAVFVSVASRQLGVSTGGVICCRVIQRRAFASALFAVACSLTAPVGGVNIDSPAEVAQVVEHGTENAGVDSSTLSLGTTTRQHCAG